MEPYNEIDWLFGDDDEKEFNDMLDKHLLTNTSYNYDNVIYIRREK